MKIQLSITLSLIMINGLGWSQNQDLKYSNDVQKEINLIKQEKAEKIDNILSIEFTENKINGCFLVAEKGEIIYNKSFGIANESTGEKLNENSIFELASVSKQFTAMAIMILKEQGKLNLEDDIKKYIPELSIYNGITIRNLLNHTGGLDDYMMLMDLHFDKNKIATNRDMIDLFVKYQPPVLFQPNSKFEYSNTGYVLLASIIEKISGKTYADFLVENIFNPLKMNHSFINRRRYAPKKIDNYAFGYVYSDSLKKFVLPDDLNETKFVIYLDGIVGDGSVNSTVLDLLKWDRALYTNELLSKQGMEEIFSPTILNDKSKSYYGFGWMIADSKEQGKITSHTGGWPGYLTFIERNIDADKTIIFLSNHDIPSIPILYRELSYKIANQKFEGPKSIYLSDNQLSEYTGVFIFKQNNKEKFYKKISLKDNKLYVMGQRGVEEEIICSEKDHFYYKDDFLWELIFIRDNKNKVCSYNEFHPFNESMNLFLRTKEEYKSPFLMLEKLKSTIEQSKIEETIKLFHSYFKDNKKEPIFEESELNNLGYVLLRKKMILESIAIFKLNVEQYSNSWNVYDSLAEAYVANGQNQVAIEFYEKSIQLNPENLNGIEVLKKLKEGK